MNVHILLHSVSAGGQIDFFRLGKVQKMDSSQYVYVLTTLFGGFGNVAGSQKKNIEEKSNYSTIQNLTKIAIPSLELEFRVFKVKI